MSWTAPRTWVTAETVTAAIMNTHVRDNLLETAPAKAAAAGDIFYATAANTVGVLTQPGDTHFMLRGGASAPSWTAISGFIQISADVDTSNFTMSTAYQNTAAAVTFNPGWGEFSIVGLAVATIAGGGSGNRFEVRIFDGTAGSNPGDMGAGAAGRTCAGSSVFAATAYTASTTWTVQVKQTDVGTLGAFDSASILAIATRTS